MKEWWSISDLLELGHHMLPQSFRGIMDFAENNHWNEDKNRCRDVPASGGKGGVRREYRFELLPAFTQAHIINQAMMDEVEIKRDETVNDLRSESLWHVYATAAGSLKKTAEKRLKIMQTLDALTPQNEIGHAMALVSIQHDVPLRTLYRWREAIHGVPKSDWLPALLPANIGRTATAPCDQRAWDMVVSDYLRPSEPSFASCYARMKEAAEAEGWSPIPAKVTLLRRVEKEFGPAAIIAARKGENALAQLYPAQTRDRAVFHAMEAVNADGHVFDVFVKFDDGSIGRPCLIGFQDLYSGMVLSHRISRTENKETTRLAIADMVESWGIPEHVYFDNGRAFMSKWITGGMKHRFRFKVKDEEPRGVLTQLSVKVHNVKPYHGQAKPIERAWRDMVDRISRHPALDGAFTGNHIDAKPENYRSRAIPIDDFRKFVAQEIMRHNTRTDRNTRIAKGRSFADVFAESLKQPGTIVRKATALQRQFFLMAGEGKTARKGNGEIHLADNRYWSDKMIAFAGKKVMVRFDPENLHDDLYVYTMDGRFIDACECIEATGFNVAAAAREHAALKRKFMKANREVLELGRRLTAAQVAAQIPDPEPMDIEQAQVVGLHPAEVRAATKASQSDTLAAFTRGVDATFGNVLSHPGNKKGDG